MNRPLETVYLSPNPTQQHCRDAIPGLTRTFLQKGFRVILDTSCDPVQGAQIMGELDAVKACDFIVVVGGDGTILRKGRLAADYNKPLLGINLGTVGFLSGLELFELDKLDLLRTGSFDLDHRMALDVQVINEQAEVLFSSFALNDAVVERSIRNKTVPLAVRCDGKDLLSYRGDGVIVSTPTGSTAYSLSAGGPIMEPSCDCLVVAPICPHSLWIRPFVVPGTRSIELIPTGWRVPMHLSVDGYIDFELQPGNKVCLCRSEKYLSLIRLDGVSFYQRIVAKLS